MSGELQPKVLVRGAIQLFSGIWWTSEEYKDFMEIVIISPEVWKYDEFTYALVDDTPVRFVRAEVTIRHVEPILL